MPEVSDEVVELASLAMLRVFLRLPGRHRPSSGAVPPAGQAADLRHLQTELHDHTIQRLAALAWQADLIPDDAGTAVAQEARAILEELRAIVLEDGAPTADRIDLLSALRGLTDEHAATATAIHLVLLDETGGRRTRVPDDVTEHAFRVACEAVGNALRHGGATAVTVEASLGVDRLHLAVRDDGRGIDSRRMTHARGQGHLGLGAMEHRATVIGARLAIESNARGTAITLDWRR
ncbi:MAG: hypothetical protein U0667_01840 [Chloroflexota bacterium]